MHFPISTGGDFDDFRRPLSPRGRRRRSPYRGGAGLHGGRRELGWLLRRHSRRLRRRFVDMEQPYRLFRQRSERGRAAGCARQRPTGRPPRRPAGRLQSSIRSLCPWLRSRRFLRSVRWIYGLRRGCRARRFRRSLSRHHRPARERRRAFRLCVWADAGFCERRHGLRLRPI